MPWHLHSWRISENTVCNGGGKGASGAAPGPGPPVCGAGLWHWVTLGVQSAAPAVLHIPCDGVSWGPLGPCPTLPHRKG